MDRIYLFGFMLFLALIVYAVTKLKNSNLQKIPNDAVFIDVRTPGEFASGSIAKAVNIPVADITKRKDEVLSMTNGSHDKPIVVYCASGIRSKMAQASLRSMGFTSTINGGAFAVLERRI